MAQRRPRSEEKPNDSECNSSHRHWANAMTPNAPVATTPIRIAVIDDHPIVRDGLVAVLGDEPDFEVAGTAASAEDGLRLVALKRPDVILLDLELPAASGIESLPHFLEAAPEAKVVVFTAYDSEERVLGALRAGARGYLLKGAPSAEIARAIRTVHAGGSHLDPRVAATVVAELSGQGSNAGRAQRRDGQSTALSERERQVLRLVADGRSNKEIARTLAIAERTAKFHVTSVMNKLGAENRAQAAVLAVQRGLL
jgi:DNA-binding NarL/FixJ family response regulator